MRMLFFTLGSILCFAAGWNLQAGGSWSLAIAAIGTMLMLYAIWPLLTADQIEVYNKAPEPSTHRIVCAAIRHPVTGQVVLGVRHFDALMDRFAERIEDGQPVKWDQGFVDNRYQFLTREEAWPVAKNACQIIRRVGGDRGDRLFSENLY